MTTHEIWALVVVGGLVVVLGGLFWLLVWRRERPDVRSEGRVIDGIRYYRTDARLPDRRRWVAADGAGWIPGAWSTLSRARYGVSAYLTGQEWEDLDSDTQAEQLIQEWHAGEEHERTALVEDHVTAWLDDPDLIVWDAKQQAARCWEILHIEFPRLRAELGIAA